MRFGYMRYRRPNQSSLSLKRHDSNMKAAGLRAVLQSCFLLGLALYSGLGLAAPNPLDALKSRPYLQAAAGPFSGFCIGPKIPLMGGGSTALGLYPCKPCATWTPSSVPICSFKWEVTSLGQLNSIGCLTSFGTAPGITSCYAKGDSRVKSDQGWSMGSDGLIKASSGKCIGAKAADADPFKLLLVDCKGPDAVKFQTSSAVQACTPTEG